MAKRSEPKSSTDTDTTTTKDDVMTDTDTPTEATDTDTPTVTPDTIEGAVDLFLTGDTDVIGRTVANLKGGARTAASGRAVQHMMATGAAPERIGEVATAVQSAIEATRSTPAAKATMTPDQAKAATEAVQDFLTLGEDLAAFFDGTDLQRSAIKDTLTKIHNKVNVTTGERRTIRYDWPSVKGRKVNLSSGDDKFTGVMQSDGKVKVEGADAPEALSPAACRLTGQKSVRGTQAWTLTDGIPVGDAAMID